MHFLDEDTSRYEMFCTEIYIPTIKLFTRWLEYRLILMKELHEIGIAWNSNIIINCRFMQIIYFACIMQICKNKFTGKKANHCSDFYFGFTFGSPASSTFGRTSFNSNQATRLRTTWKNINSKKELCAIKYYVSMKMLRVQKRHISFGLK